MRGVANDRCLGYLQTTNEGNLQPHAGLNSQLPLLFALNRLRNAVKE